MAVIRGSWCYNPALPVLRHHRHHVSTDLGEGRRALQQEGQVATESLNSELAGSGWVQSLSQRQEGGPWYLSESVTNPWPYCPGDGEPAFSTLGPQGWDPSPTSVTPRPLKREQKRKASLPMALGASRLKGCLLSSLSQVLEEQRGKSSSGHGERERGGCKRCHEVNFSGE